MTRADDKLILVPLAHLGSLHTELYAMQMRLRRLSAYLIALRVAWCAAGFAIGSAVTAAALWLVQGQR